MLEFHLTSPAVCLQDELSALQTDLERLQLSGGDNEEEKERNEQIENQYEADKTKLSKMRLAIVSVIKLN